MNVSSLLGLLSGIALLAAAFMTATKNYIVFLDSHAILVVIGGTAAASLMCFPAGSFLRIAKVFIQKYLGNY